MLLNFKSKEAGFCVKQRLGVEADPAPFVCQTAVRSSGLRPTTSVSAENN